MQKIGRQRIEKNRNDSRPALCAHCQEPAVFRVSFADTWAKITVSLCEACAQKPYESLNLQSRIAWPEKK